MNTPASRRPSPILTSVYSRFFFFQAEDGIRDLTVTGVQTCALPISLAMFGWLAGRALRIGRQGVLARVGDSAMALAAIGAMAIALFLTDAVRHTKEEIGRAHV